MKVPGTPRSNLRDILDAVTTRSLLKPVPALTLTIFTTIVHIVSSVDLGFSDLLIRTLMAVLSVAPLFVCIWIAHLISNNKRVLLYLLVPLSYIVGGGLRGALLEELLITTGVLQGDFTSYRIYAGVPIVTTTSLFVAYAWATAERAGNVVNHLRNEATALELALGDLKNKSDEVDDKEVLRIKEAIEKELIKVSEIESTELQSNLRVLIDETVRPLSQDFAKEIKEWKAPGFDSLRLSFRGFWRSIDPVKHLPTPIVSVVALVLSTIASLFAFFDLRNALELIIGVSISSLISYRIFYSVMRRWFSDLTGTKRDFAITFMLFLMALPPVYIQTVALADTDDPYIYVTATLIVTPLFGWLILTGSAALGLSRSVTRELREIRNNLKWVVARINLLSWYRRGVISRLLHGPIQNSVQVALLRLKSADEGQAETIIREVIARIDSNIQAILNPAISVPGEMLSLKSIQEIWGGVAAITIDFKGNTKIALEEDVAATAIVTDLLHEICSNSIRHGQAKNISIYIDASNGIVDIEVEDDGISVINIENSSGLGIKFLDACTISWERTRVKDMNILRLKVPTTFQSQVVA